MKPIVLSALAALILGHAGVHAHGDSTGKPRAGAPDAARDAGESGAPFGRPGKPKAVGRAVMIRMSDAMRFTPDSLTVKRGETIRFIVRNEGKLFHEMVLGNDEGLKAHAALMRRFPEMEHDEPYMVHVAPGKTGEMIWTFDKPGQIGFACLVPGHYEAGMTGKVIAK